MKRFLAAAFVFTMGVAVHAETEGPIQWRHDYAKAYAEAKAANKILLINVHTTWCGPCRMLQQTTLKDPSLVTMIEKNCVPLSLDGDEHADLVRRLGVQAFPTQVFVAPDGKIVGRMEGYKPANAYANMLGMALAQAAPAMKAVAESKPAATPQPAAKTTIAASVATASPQPKPAASESAIIQDSEVKPCSADGPLALKGFCPVTMISKAQLVDGDASTCVMFAGNRYVFSSPAERAMFEKNPRKYLPAADGVCLVTLLDSGKVAQGDVECPAIYEDKVYLFANAAQRRKFLDDPEKFVQGWRQASHRLPTFR